MYKSDFVAQAKSLVFSPEIFFISIISGSKKSLTLMELLVQTFTKRAFSNDISVKHFIW